MCGIYGIWNRDGRPVDLHALVRATRSISHRGPDDEGYVLIDTRRGEALACGGSETNPELGLPPVESLTNDRFDLALGFRRLSILDLSPAGHQPMPSADRRQWIIFNGEIYNYLELRDELRTHGFEFRSGSDTEVILAAYRKWGRDCVQRFNGMWSFALWDFDRKELFVSRDRFGIKPLQYATPGRTFAFASELKALIRGGEVPFEPRRDVLVEYLALGRMPSPRRGDTFFEGIRSLPAAHQFVVGNDTLDVRRYWSIPADRSNGAADKALVDEYRALFDSAVKLHLRADVPTGTLLSGGLDSSSIVATANGFLEDARSGTELHGLTQETFSAIYEDQGPWNERRFIDSVVAKTGVHPNFVVPTADRLWNELDQFLWHHDEPVSGTSEFAEWCVMRLVKERGITVVLVGQGADEIFGGYRPIFRTAFREQLRRGALLPAWRMAVAAGLVDGESAARIAATETVKGAARSLLPVVARRAFERRMESTFATVALNRGVTGEYLRAKGIGTPPAPWPSARAHTVEWFEEYPLPHNLHWSDRNSMASSVESRVPFLDYRIVEFVFGRASRLSIHDGWSKWIHRASMDDRLPDDVRWRRDKIGFATPELRWIAGSTDRLRAHFASPTPLERELLDVEAIRRQIEEPATEAGAAQLWRYTAASAWMRRFAEAAR
jgi:asparagine synthase (glutamine-hydrolysing)